MYISSVIYLAHSVIVKFRLVDEFSVILVYAYIPFKKINAMRAVTSLVL